MEVDGKGVELANTISVRVVRLSINLQQLKMKVAKLTQTRSTPFQGRVFGTIWW
jgi:hypothetical protein